MPSEMQNEQEAETDDLQLEKLSRLRKKQATKRMEQLIRLHADNMELTERQQHGDGTSHMSQPATTVRN